MTFVAFFLGLPPGADAGAAARARRPWEAGSGGSGGMIRRRLRESRTPGGREGLREEGLCRTLTCLSVAVAVTGRGHHCESRAQLHRPPWGTRRLPPTHFFPFPSTYFLPVLSFSPLRGLFHPHAVWRCQLHATVTHLVTPAPWHSHTEPTLLTHRVPPRLHCPPDTSVQMSHNPLQRDSSPHPRTLDITAPCGLHIRRSPSPFPFLLCPCPVISH